MKNIIIDIYSVIDQENEAKQTIEMVSEGEWFEKNGASYIMYMESEISGMAGSKTMLKIEDDVITMTRFGATASKMVFDIKNPMTSFYKTPYGNFEMKIETNHLAVDLKHETLSGELIIKYHMSLEQVSNSINEMHIKIRAAG